MNPFLYWFYQFLKLIIRIGEKVFYPKVSVLNRSALEIKGPAILVCNHPNTLLDPFNAASRIWQPVYFLANASLFKSTIGNWFFSTFYCIPIQRKEDTGGKVVNNDDAFEKCDQFLGKEGILFIAPEGGSYVGRHLERIKTGTARIALSAESKNNFQLGLKILPVGLLYESPGTFRSSFVINVGDPFTVEHLADDYKKDGFGTAKKLTATIKDELERLIINPIDEAEDLFLSQAEVMLRSQEKNEAKIIQWVQELAQTVRATPDQEKLALYLSTKNYQQELDDLKIDDKTVFGTTVGNISPYRNLAFLIVGFPIFLYGLLNHAILLFAMNGIWSKLQLYPTYESTVKFMVLLIVLPFSYFLQSLMVEWVISTQWSWWYLVTLPVFGIFSSYYWKMVQKWKKEWQLLKYNKETPEKIHAIKQHRKHLWQRLSSITSSTSS